MPSIIHDDADLARVHARREHDAAPLLERSGRYCAKRGYGEDGHIVAR